MNDDSWALQNFSGTARLFPLPNLVLFPHVVQPLHVFEPCYRDLTTDALAGDNLIAMALLKPDWESDQGERPPIHPIVCLGRIVANQRLDDGRFLLLLRGLSRARVVKELDSERPYRTAKLELMPDVVTQSIKETQRIRHQLAEMILPRFSGSDEDKQRLKDLFEGEMPLGPLIDCLCFQLPLTVPRKQEMLEETDVGTRARTLVDALNTIASNVPRKFPPEFSAN
jgi:Lon protease-like protein